jgi:hypothetical protein
MTPDTAGRLALTRRGSGCIRSTSHESHDASPEQGTRRAAWRPNELSASTVWETMKQKREDEHAE